MDTSSNRPTSITVTTPIVGLSNSTAGLLSTAHRRMSSWTHDDMVAQSESLTVCLVCGNSREEAVVLRCQHVFCHACLKLRSTLLNELQNDNIAPLEITCPICNGATPIPAEGIDALASVSLMGLRLDRKMALVCEGAVQRCDICCFRPSVRASVDADYYCSRCAMNLCTQCKAAHDTQTVFKSHGIIHISNKESLRLYCERHARLHCLYFCQDCQLPACCACLLVEHPNHVTSKLREALTLRRDNLKTLLNDLGPMMDKSETRLKRLLAQHHAQGYRHRTHSTSSNGTSQTGVSSATASITYSTASHGGASNGISSVSSQPNNTTYGYASRHKSEVQTPNRGHLLLPSKSLDGSNGVMLNTTANGTAKESTSFFKSLKGGRKNQSPTVPESIPLLDTCFNNGMVTMDGKYKPSLKGEDGEKTTRVGPDREDSIELVGVRSNEIRSSTTISIQSNDSGKSNDQLKPLELYTEYFEHVRQVRSIIDIFTLLACLCGQKCFNVECLYIITYNCINMYVT